MERKNTRQQERPVRPREASQILTALEGGVVPIIGIQHLLVGRSREVEEIFRILDRVEDGSSDMRLWVGDFGSGKSFMLRTIEQFALQNNFVTATVDLTPARRFHASDGKALALYQELISQLRTRGASDGGVLAGILEQWLYSWLPDLGIDPNQGSQVDKRDLLLAEKKILETIESLGTASLSFELGQAIVQYLRGMLDGNITRKLQALRWIGGLITTKTEAKRELGISQIVNDDNWVDMVLNLTALFRQVGYSGFVVNFDEVVNLYKLPRSQTREQNYERILNLYNVAKTGEVKGLFVNLGATRNTVFNERRGMSSYGALKGRFGLEQENLERLVDTHATVQILKPLTAEEIFTLLEKLQDIYQVIDQSDQVFNEQQIETYMEAQLNRPGAGEFLTPRAVIKDFLQLLSLARQNKDVGIDQLLEMRFGSFGDVVKDEDDHDDDFDIEII